MKKKLAVRGLRKLLSGVIALGLLLFLPAGTFQFPGAWRMILIMFVPMMILGTILLFGKPELLARRLNQKESEKTQKTIILISLLLFIVCFLLCAFDFRYSWSYVPLWLSMFGCIVFLLTYLGFAELLRENEYLSRTVEVQSNQRVVSTGLYGLSGIQCMRSSFGCFSQCQLLSDHSLV